MDKKTNPKDDKNIKKKTKNIVKLKKIKYTKEEIIWLIDTLIKMYPDATCSLDFTTPFQMLVSVVLSAQCTDERVNKTTPSLFAKYPGVDDFADIDIKTLEKYIHPCGFYHNKAKNIKAAAIKVKEDFNGVVPKTMEELISIPGVGRKSANVIMLEAFDTPVGIAVDTHAKRISNRLGLSIQTDPEKVEMDLLKVLPKKYYKDVNHLLVWHGRNLCTSISPKCYDCPLKIKCGYYQNIEK